MMYLAVALAMIFLSNAIAVQLAFEMDVSRYFDLMVICDRLGESAENCKANSEAAGIVSCAGAVIVGILLILAARRFPQGKTTGWASSGAFCAVGLLVLAVAAYNGAMEALLPIPIYRDEAFTTRSAVISLSNLLWPICLQMSNRASSLRWRIAFMALLFPILELSAFRGVFFAVAVFGIAVPSAEIGLQFLKRGLIKKNQIVKYGAVAGLVGMLLISQIILETMQRSSNLNLAGKSATARLSETLAQRLTIPIFQSHLALSENLDPAIPSIGGEIAAKVRIGDSLNINQFLFAKTHNGASFGETTSQFLGEGALRTESDPIVWVVVAPWILVLTWAIFRQIGVEIETLIGVAVWRSSLSGLVAVLPALVIQIVLYVALWARQKSKKEALCAV